MRSLKVLASKLFDPAHVPALTHIPAHTPTHGAAHTPVHALVLAAADAPTHGAAHVPAFTRTPSHAAAHTPSHAAAHTLALAAAHALPLALVLTLTLLLTWAEPAWSQQPAAAPQPPHSQLIVPEPAATDATALERALPDLARQALTHLPTDPLLRLEYQFRFQLASAQYEEALATLDQWHKARPAPPPDQTVEPFLRHEVYARTKVLEARENIPFGEALKKVIEQKFAGYSDRVAADSAWNLELPPQAARANLDAQLARLKGKRTLSPVELVDALRWHATLQAVESFAPTLAAAISVDDAKRFVIDRGVSIRTRDGATVVADIVRPKRATGPMPAALHHTIYTDLSSAMRGAKDAAARGYAGVQSNSRGKYLSTDEIRPWEMEVEDTWAVIDWISKQPWSDGKVGMYGHSYNGFSAWAAAKSRHPALKTIVPSGSSPPGNGLPMQNNVFLTSNYGWSLQTTNDRFMGDPALLERSQWNQLVVKWFESGRPMREIDAIDGRPNKVLQRQMLHPSYDKYWQDMQPYRQEFARIDIPVLSLTGYFDDAGSAAVDYVVEHYRYHKNPQHYFVIGPYPHRLDGPKDAVVRGYVIDPVANIDSMGLVYAWFDHVMRGGPKPALLKDRINYQVMGANTWRHAPSIARASNRTLRLYLTDQKVGRRYDLSSRRPATDGFVEQVVDLADRKSRNNVFPVSAYLATPDSLSQVVYVSEPFEEPVFIDGLLTGTLKASIDRRDLDFSLALYEAMPDGRYFNLYYYLGRASYAADETTRKLLSPGKVASLPFARTGFMGRQLAKGSRLILLVTANKNDYSQVNYGSGKDVSDESVADAKRPLRIQWHNGSFIDVPLRVGGAEGTADKRAVTSSRASGT